MIKRSALPKNVITKVIGDTKLVRTLAGHLKTQEVVMMCDLRLPEFDKNRHINQQKVFDKDNVKYDIILGTNFLSKTGIMLNYSEGNMEWFDCSSLVKIGLNALQQRFWMPSMKRLMYLRL